MNEIKRTELARKHLGQGLDGAFLKNTLALLTEFEKTHIEAITVTQCCTELPTCYSTELAKIEQLRQTQASTRHQLEVLRVFANRLGLYDACDYLKEK